jgi:LPPG:FO 2-phospho-L-lactate transferase
VLSGGTGTPKLLQGFMRVVDQKDLSIIVNTGEDVEVSGLHVSPDLDSVMYTLAGIIDEQKWWGIRGDSFITNEFLKLLGENELLRLGDRDRAINIYRTLLMERGVKLSEVTKTLCSRFGIKANVLPMSDDKVRTLIHTEAGPMWFHQFLIARQAKDVVTGVEYVGAENAEPAPEVLETISKAEAVIIGPSNPITSIGPILSIKKIKEALILNREKVIAVSPIIGDSAVSGPAGALMRGLNYEVSPAGVARIYQEVASKLVVDSADKNYRANIAKLGIKPIFLDILMKDISTKKRLASEIVSIVKMERELFRHEKMSAQNLIKAK